MHTGRGWSKVFHFLISFSLVFTAVFNYPLNRIVISADSVVNPITIEGSLSQEVVHKGDEVGLTYKVTPEKQELIHSNQPVDILFYMYGYFNSTGMRATLKQKIAELVNKLRATSKPGQYSRIMFVRVSDLSLITRLYVLDSADPKTEGSKLAEKVLTTDNTVINNNSRMDSQIEADKKNGVNTDGFSSDFRFTPERMNEIKEFSKTDNGRRKALINCIDEKSIISSDKQPDIQIQTEGGTNVRLEHIFTDSRTYHVTLSMDYNSQKEKVDLTSIRDKNAPQNGTSVINNTTLFSGNGTYSIPDGVEQYHLFVKADNTPKSVTCNNKPVTDLRICEESQLSEQLDMIIDRVVTPIIKDISITQFVPKGFEIVSVPPGWNIFPGTGENAYIVKGTIPDINLSQDVMERYYKVVVKPVVAGKTVLKYQYVYTGLDGQLVIGNGEFKILTVVNQPPKVEIIRPIDNEKVGLEEPFILADFRVTDPDLVDQVKDALKVRVYLDDGTGYALINKIYKDTNSDGEPDTPVSLIQGVMKATSGDEIKIGIPKEFQDERNVKVKVECIDPSDDIDSGERTVICCNQLILDGQVTIIPQNALVGDQIKANMTINAKGEQKNGIIRDIKVDARVDKTSLATMDGGNSFTVSNTTTENRIVLNPSILSTVSYNPYPDKPETKAGYSIKFGKAGEYQINHDVEYTVGKKVTKTLFASPKVSIREGIINVKVRNNKDEGLKDVVVTVFKNGVKIGEAKTDEAGNVRIGGLSSDQYTVKVQKPDDTYADLPDKQLALSYSTNEQNCEFKFLLADEPALVKSITADKLQCLSGDRVKFFVKLKPVGKENKGLISNIQVKAGLNGSKVASGIEAADIGGTNEFNINPGGFDNVNFNPLPDKSELGAEYSIKFKPGIYNIPHKLSYDVDSMGKGSESFNSPMIDVKEGKLRVRVKNSAGVLIDSVTIKIKKDGVDFKTLNSSSRNQEGYVEVNDLETANYTISLELPKALEEIYNPPAPVTDRVEYSNNDVARELILITQNGPQLAATVAPDKTQCLAGDDIRFTTSFDIKGYEHGGRITNVDMKGVFDNDKAFSPSGEGFTSGVESSNPILFKSLLSPPDEIKFNPEPQSTMGSQMFAVKARASGSSGKEILSYRVDGKIEPVTEEIPLQNIDVREGRITIKLLDTASKPVAGVSVRMVKEGTVVGTGTSDNTGKLVISGSVTNYLSSGSYRVFWDLPTPDLQKKYAAQADTETCNLDYDHYDITKVIVIKKNPVLGAITLKGISGTDLSKETDKIMGRQSIDNAKLKVKYSLESDVPIDSIEIKFEVVSNIPNSGFEFSSPNSPLIWVDNYNKTVFISRDKTSDPLGDKIKDGINYPVTFPVKTQFFGDGELLVQKVKVVGLKINGIDQDISKAGDEADRVVTFTVYKKIKST